MLYLARSSLEDGFQHSNLVRCKPCNAVAGHHERGSLIHVNCTARGVVLVPMTTCVDEARHRTAANRAHKNTNAKAIGDRPLRIDPLSPCGSEELESLGVQQAGLIPLQNSSKTKVFWSRNCPAACMIPPHSLYI
jgi:hypothetical protein